MEKFRDKYRIPSARLKDWNYCLSASYFVTICTLNRKDYFGEIQNEKMILNEIGQIANDEWIKTPDIRPDMNLELGEFVVMPNHFHGIINIGENDFNRNQGGFTNHKNKIGSQSKNLGSVIRGFKSAVTTYAKKNYIEFGWQERFHDHIIRSYEEYVRISQYIIDNPANWHRDKLND